MYMIKPTLFSIPGIVPRKQRHVVKAESSEGQYGKRLSFYPLADLYNNITDCA